MHNYHSRTSFGGIARKRSSMAQIVSNTLLKGQPAKPSSISLLRGQGQLIKPQSPEGEVIEDMYLEEILHSGEKDEVDNASKKNNVRAKLGFFRLLVHDFKIWKRRWKNKQIDQPFFRKKIKEIESNFGSSIGALFVFTRWVLMTNLVLSFFWLCLVVVPMAITFPYANVTHGFTLRNLIDGQGVLGEVWVFYGGYKPWTLGDNYYLALAYLSLIIITYFGTLFVILKSIGKAASPRSTSAAESRFRFSLMLLSSWDYSVTSSQASKNLSKCIVSMLKDHIYEAKAKDAAYSTNKSQIIGLRILAWFITVLIIGGACVTIVFLVIYVNFTDQAPNSKESNTDFIQVYGTPIVFSLVNLLVPAIITKLPLIEKYSSGKVELSITLARVFCLRMANLFALIVTLYSRLTKLTYDCTGTVIGQELYKLVVMDTFVHLFGQLAVNYIRYFWTQEKSEFVISGQALVLIYRQGLIWVGTLACPLLPLIGVFSDVVFFYVNYYIVRDTCKPPLKRWSQSRNTGFLTAFLLITLILIIIPISIVIGSQQVINLGQSSSCGPFGQEKPTSVYTKFQLQQSPLFQRIMQWAVSDSVVLPLFLLLLAYIFYQRVLISGEKRHRLILQAELLQESEDNADLLGKLQGIPSYS
ncbi:transmembrane channel-like protein 3 [Saccostrea cucullata]|uniref:transmembrane channel-like protein 3 n=1 Tax=Saccostrea cuccullata TaxID=36930 RepID=UPI002ED08FA9